MSYRRARAADREPRRSRFVFLLSLIAIVASLLTPVLTLTASDAAAQGQPPNCDAGYVVSDDGTTCVPDPNQGGETPTDVATEPPPDVSTQEATEDIPLATAYLQVNKYDCPPIMDWSQAAYSDLQQNCAPNQNPVSISVTTMNGEGSTESVGNSFTWGPFTAGQAQISESVGPGYDTPWIACSDSGAPGTPARTASTTWPLTDNTTSTCEIYNIHLVGSATIYKWQCDEGTEYGRELEYYQGGLPDQETGPCEQEHLNIPIQLTDAYGPRQQPNTTQANGTQFDNIVLDGNGSFQVAITEPEGFGDPMVFCATLDQQTQQPVPATGAIITLLPGAAPFQIQCNWYDIPVQQNSITIYKWLCEPGTEYGQPLEYYEGSLPDQETGPCEQEHLNIPIHLIDGGPPAPEKDTTTQANGTQFDNVVLDANGSFQVWIEEPEGFGDPMVFCATLDQDTQSPVTVTDGRITITPTGEPFTYQCNWYNLPGGTTTTGVTGMIVIEKYWCPPVLNFVQTPTRADMQGACQEEPGTGANFTLTGPTAAPQTWPDMQPSGPSPQSFNWADLPEGEYTITENGLTGWTSTVYCHESSGQPNGAADEMLAGPSVTRTLQPGYTIDCAWFNQPPQMNENSITIYKWQCVDGTEYGQPLDYYEGSLPDQETGPCEQEHLNIPIHLIHGGPQQDTTTQANGTQFDNVVLDANGSFQVWIEEPEGFGDPMVFCATLDQDTQSPVTVTDGRITITPTGEPFTYQCNWYNIPGEGTDNSVTVYKWQCEPGTLYGQTMAYYQGENGDAGPCETEHLNIPIHLIHGGPQQDTTTQANGTQFDNIVLDANGGFQIWIEEPDGYGDPMVWCWPTEGDPGTEPIAAPGGTWTVTPGGEPFSWQCNVYDIPEGAYQLELYKYTCEYTVDRNLGLEELFTHQDCAPKQGVSFIASFGGNPGSAYTTDANGYLNWPGVDSGPWSLTEGATPGYAAPKVYCGPPQSAETPETPVSNLTVSGTLDQTTPHIICVWFNFEQQTENGRITVYKYQCPPGTTATDFGLLAESCTTPHNGIGYNLSGPATNISASTVAGTVDWTNLDQGAYTVTETTVLPGYLTPVVYCGIVLQDGAPIDPGSVQWMNQPVTNQAIQLTLDNFPKRIVCYWYNIPSDYGEITIYKWTCPAGYDLSAWGADPKVDCKQATNGVTFTLTPPVGQVLQTNTGDSIPGAVYFGGLNPGSYTVTETVPQGTAYVFVLDCTGTDIPKVHQFPLSWGPTLDINVAGGDKIVCHWYNVPKLQTGWVTVHKYVCSTTTFVDKVYCVTYEKGQAFELFQVNGNVSKGVGITNSGGTYTWDGLAPGAYTIREDKGVPCKMTASNVDGKGNARVVAGEGTTINVYNCTSTPGKVPPGKVPGKYPNTGVGPDAVESLMPANLPAMQGEPASTPSAEDEAASEAFYQVDCISGSVDTGTPVPSTPVADATMPPIEAEPTEAPADAAMTPTPPATPEVGVGECQRGAIPTHLTIPSIGVDADFEYKEIVDGVMEQPTGPEQVAWYKNTARLGETNNVVVAGHLNWWNVPEGVFYRLQDMQEGDRIEVTGDDGMVYTYEVRSVTQESNLEEPSVEVIGPTDEPTLTLITCGGEWNADIAEYDQRTVVRAVQVDVQPAEAASS